MTDALPSGAERERKSHLWARDPDDWYVEPRWCDDALFAAIKFEGAIVDPCCGLGRILDAAKDAGYDTIGMDIHDRGAGDRHPFGQRDFFTVDDCAPNIVCNPPYKYADRFVARCVDRATRKAAVLLRAQWANGAARSRWLEGLPPFGMSWRYRRVRPCRQARWWSPANGSAAARHRKAGIRLGATLGAVIRRWKSLLAVIGISV